MPGCNALATHAWLNQVTKIDPVSSPIVALMMTFRALPGDLVDAFMGTGRLIFLTVA
jgi:hypothetical protein